MLLVLSRCRRSLTCGLYCSQLRKTPNPGGGSPVNRRAGRVGSNISDHRSSSQQQRNLSGSKSWRRNYCIHPTQSVINLGGRRAAPPVCEKSVSGQCESPFCSSVTPLPVPDPNLIIDLSLHRPRTAPQTAPRTAPQTAPSDTLGSLPCRGAAGCCRNSCCRLPGNENKVCDPLCPFHKEISLGLVGVVLSLLCVLATALNGYSLFDSAEALRKNQEIEFERNKERFNFLKWGAKAFKNMLIVPPGSGIVHQVRQTLNVSHRFGICSFI